MRFSFVTPGRAPRAPMKLRATFCSWTTNASSNDGFTYRLYYITSTGCSQKITKQIALKSPKTISNYEFYTQMAELIRMYEAPRQLRPRGANILQCSPATLNFSRNALCHAVPAVWNKLSETVTSDITVSIATFKTRLKTAPYAFLRWHCDLSHLRFFTFVNDLMCLNLV